MSRGIGGGHLGICKPAQDAAARRAKLSGRTLIHGGKCPEGRESRGPQLWNPRSGYAYNSNNSPFLANDPADNLRPADFPASQGLQTNITNRALRIHELVGADHAVTNQAFRRYKFDLAYSEQSAVTAMVRQVTAADPGGDADLKAAQAMLRGWDRRTDAHNRAAPSVPHSSKTLDGLEAAGFWRETPGAAA